jgi:hypothetical protein
VSDTVASFSDLRQAASDEEIFAGRAADPYTIAVRAYVWGFPLVQMARIRLYGTQPDDPFAERPPTSTGAPLNRWGHQSVAADPTFRAGVGPSVDLLYSSLRLDLASGPFVVEFPDCGPDYYTVQIAFADSSAEHSFGRRTHGSQLPSLLIRGPGSSAAAPGGAIDVASPTRYCMLPTRFLFDLNKPGDLARVRRLQSQLRVRTLADYIAGRDQLPSVPDQRPLAAKNDAMPHDLDYVHELGSVLQDWIVQPSDRDLIKQLARIGLSTASRFQPERSNPAERPEVARGLRDGAEVVRRKSLSLGTQHNGWTINYLGPRFGPDRLLRAGVAKDQIVVTVPEEALYPICRQDVDGAPLNGSNSYSLLFSGDFLPPADAFWSVTLYDDDGYLVANPIDRYSISDRTPGLVRGHDGSIDLTISTTRPRDQSTNWLPAPPSTFYLMLRLYIPRPPALNGSWLPPPVRHLPKRA